MTNPVIQIDINPEEFIFWSVSTNKKGSDTIEIAQDDYLFFLNKLGFYQMRLGDYYDNTAQIVYVQSKNKVIEPVDPVYIKKYILNFFQINPNINNKSTRPILLKLMKSEHFYFGSGQLSFLPFFDKPMLRDTENKSYAFFLNTAVEITKSNVTEIPYVDLPGFIWRSAINNKHFIRSSGKNSLFRSFVKCISTMRIDDGKNEERFMFNCSVYGYLLHTYKDEANAKAVVMSDMKLPLDGQDSEEGGTGKGLLGRSIGHFRKYHWVDGKSLEKTDDKFIYQDVKPDTKVIFIDDVNKKFDFIRFFNNITGDMKTEQKNKKPITIPFKDSPKLLFSTNYAIKSNSTSTIRRKIDMEFSDFFDIHNTPFTELKCQLFADFDHIQWNEYYNFCINCIQHYLINGIHQIDTQSVDVKRLLAKYGYDFYAFWIKVNKSGAIPKKSLYDLFIEQSGWDQHKTSKKLVTDMVKAYFKLNNMQYRDFLVNNIPCYIFPDFSSGDNVVQYEKIIQQNISASKDEDIPPF